MPLKWTNQLDHPPEAEKTSLPCLAKHIRGCGPLVGEEYAKCEAPGQACALAHRVLWVAKAAATALGLGSEHIYKAGTPAVSLLSPHGRPSAGSAQRGEQGARPSRTIASSTPTVPALPPLGM